MDEQKRHSLFSQLIARHQSELYAYIFAIVRNWEDADDLLQSVCVVLWQKFDSFRPGTSFFAWARQTAKFKVRQFLAHKPVPNCVSETLLDALVETNFSCERGEVEFALAALRCCRGKLAPADGELLELRYVEDLSTRDIAERLQRPQPSVCRSLNRIRDWLLECIKMEMARQEHPGHELS
jgi:RNA polymerase sigma-70 factor, ECF subfamily